MDYKINHNNSVGMSTKTNPAVIITQTFEDFAPPPPPRDPNGDIILPSGGADYPLEFVVFQTNFVRLISYASDPAELIGPSLISAYYNGADFPVKTYTIIYPPVGGGGTGIGVSPVDVRTDENYMGWIISRNLPFISAAKMADFAQAVVPGTLINTGRVNWAGQGLLHGIYVLKGSDKGIFLNSSGVLYSYRVRFFW